MFDPHDLTQSNVIYGLHAGDDVIRYVGLTTGPLEKRFRAHKSQADAGDSSYKSRWMRSVGLRNIKCVVLYVVPYDEDIDAWEIVWIKQLRDIGYPLTNLTDGGRDARISPQGRNTYQLLSKRVKAAPPTGKGSLTKNDVFKIWVCLKNKVPIRDIAEDFGVSVDTIRKILKQKSWEKVAPYDAAEISLNYLPTPAKLTDEEYLLVKHSTEPQLVIADRYGISQARVSAIKNGKALRKGVDA